jgi:hypothetical protein
LVTHGLERPRSRFQEKKIPKISAAAGKALDFQSIATKTPICGPPESTWLMVAHPRERIKDDSLTGNRGVSFRSNATARTLPK